MKPLLAAKRAGAVTRPGALLDGSDTPGEDCHELKDFHKRLCTRCIRRLPVGALPPRTASSADFTTPQAQTGVLLRANPESCAVELIRPDSQRGRRRSEAPFHHAGSDTGANEGRGLSLESKPPVQTAHTRWPLGAAPADVRSRYPRPRTPFPQRPPPLGHRGCARAHRE